MDEIEQLRGLVAASVHFEFDDGTDCYERELTCEGRDGDRTYPAGTILWEARGCVSGPSVQWCETRDEALAAIGHGKGEA